MISQLCTFLSVLSTIGYVLIAILIFALLITIHELGHYTMGKIFKFKINEFSIGFGKAIYQKKMKNGELFAIRWIPLGGYCAFEGEDGESKVEGAFNDQAWWKRWLVLFGGVLFNFLSAVIVAIPLLMVMGNNIPKIVTVDQTTPNASVLSVDDVVLKINGQNPTFINGGLSGLTQNINKNEDITLTIKHKNGDVENVIVRKYSVLLEGETESKILIGVTTENVKYGFFQSVAMSVPFCGEMAWECLELLGKLCIGQVDFKDIGGPITTVKAIAKVSAVNLNYLLLFFPLIAVNLAVFNFLPLPALDGGRSVFVLIEAIRKKPIRRDIEAKIHTIGIMVLFAFIIVCDFLQLFIFRSV